MASLAQYLLHLAQNPEESEAFRSSHESARASMTKAGLSKEQQEIALSRDSDRIAGAVQAELHAGTPANVERLSVPLNFIICSPPKP